MEIIQIFLYTSLVLTCLELTYSYTRWWVVTRHSALKQLPKNTYTNGSPLELRPMLVTVAIFKAAVIVWATNNIYNIIVLRNLGAFDLMPTVGKALLVLTAFYQLVPIWRSGRGYSWGYIAVSIFGRVLLAVAVSILIEYFVGSPFLGFTMPMNFVISCW